MIIKDFQVYLKNVQELVSFEDTAEAVLLLVISITSHNYFEQGSSTHLEEEPSGTTKEEPTTEDSDWKDVSRISPVIYIRVSKI